MAFSVSRVWTAVRSPSKLTPGPRSGHAAARAGAHLYIFGGDTLQQSANDMWRFHFGNYGSDNLVLLFRMKSHNNYNYIFNDDRFFIYSLSLQIFINI